MFPHRADRDSQDLQFMTTFTRQIEPRQQVHFETIKAESFGWTPFPSFRPATTGSAPSQRPWLATMFAICTMRAWGVKMATVLIEKQRWHIPFCARNKTEPFTNPHIRKVGTSTCWIINFPVTHFCSFLFFPPEQLWLLLFDQCCVCVCIWACAVTLYFCPCVLLIADGTVRVSRPSPSRWRANTAEAESVRQMDWKSNNQATEWPWHLHACTAVQSQVVDTRALVARLTDWLTGHHYNVAPSFSITVCVEMAGIKTVDRCDGLSCRFTTKWI